MAKILIVGGGFGGVVAAELLAKKLGREHQITLVSRTSRFLFYPALVRLAFGRCEPDDVSFDLRDAMLDRRVTFVEGEIARINPRDHQITIARGEFTGQMQYDFLILALGRRLATEQVPGFFEHAHHLLDIDGAFKLGEAIRGFHQGHAVIGSCPGARLPVPLFETAYALADLLAERGDQSRCTITIVSSETPDEMFGDTVISETLIDALKSRRVEFVSDFAINRVTRSSVIASDGREINFDLAMLIPPFRGPGAVVGTGITDDDGYVRVETTMRVPGLDRTYAVGDCVGLSGPKMGHMAVRQAEVAAENVAAEIQGRAPSAVYDHEMMLVLEAGGPDSIFLHRDLWTNDPVSVKRGRFWAWAKRRHEQYWMKRHA
jgi:sulfide:quinone oxidoreductase